MPPHLTDSEREQLLKCLTRYFDEAKRQKILYVVGRELNDFEILAETPRKYFSDRLRTVAKAARSLVEAIDGKDWVRTVAFTKKAAEPMSFGDSFRSKLVLHEVRAVAARCERAAEANDRGRGRKLPPEQHRLIEALVTIWTSRGGPKGTTLNGPLVKFVQTAAGFVMLPIKKNTVRHRIRTARRSQKRKGGD
jgi:hypothetical protein